MSKHLARRTDPVSSHEAAAEHVASGRNQSQQDQVHDALAEWGDLHARHGLPGPMTSRELAVYMDADRYMVARRLPNLLKKRRVRQVGMRTCRISKRKVVTWVAV